MAKKRRNNNGCAPPVSIGNSSEPASYSYVQSVLRQQIASDCDNLLAEINERVARLAQKVNSLRYQ